MKINHPERIEIFDTIAVAKIKRELLSKYRQFLKSGKDYDQWSETDDGFKYMLFDLLELQDGQVYIQIDGKSTHWMCNDSTDGFMVYAGVQEIVLNDNDLTIYFLNTECQNFKFSEKYQHYEKIKNRRRLKQLSSLATT